MTEYIDVSVVIVFDGDLMLVNQRPDGSYFGGWWEWPGGKLERPETWEEAALRELSEEIGITIGPLREFEFLTVPYPGRKVNLKFFLAAIDGAPKPREDALLHRWMKPEEVRELKFLEPNLPVLERLIVERPWHQES
ncbi:MAG: (deoxy)nucleoside triphosphate pyrophosphohydrolase [Planctomycetota bacterium]|jgi:8-oxo-dGTP diphosphatase